MATISMAEIGQRLKEARERKSLTIDQARKQTRIHSNVLIALEDGKCDDILNPTYAKSFLKKYSIYLGLDSKEVLNQYSSLHPEDYCPNLNIMEKKGPKSSPDISKFIYAIGPAILIIALVVLSVFLLSKTVTYLKKHRPPKAPGVKIAQAAATAKRSVKKKSSTLQPSVPKNVPFDLVLKVKQPVLVGLKKDGILIFKRVMPKGTVESVRANDYISIYVAKAEAIELVLNGQGLNIPAKGIIKDLEITRKGIRIR